jgi:predicted ribosome quality control (RQC) complex YloA/Tae2 family protein
VLSLAELARVSDFLDGSIRGHRIQAIAQPDAHTIVLDVYGSGRDGEGQRLHLLLSCRPGSARVSLAAASRNAPGGPPRFAQYLRAHMKGARIERVRLLDGDRQLALRVRTKEGDFDLLLSIFGARSNLVVLNADGSIVDSLRPLAETRSELSKGEAWRAPASSPPRAGEDRFAEHEGEALLRAIEAHYAASEEEDEEGALRRRVEAALRKEVKTLDRKIEKLERELLDAERATASERQGELLKSALADVQKGDAQAVVRDWDTGEDVNIPLDTTLTPAENMERLFKRYRKALRTLTKGGAQLDAVRASRAEIAALEQDYEEARQAGHDALESLVQRPALARLLSKFAPGPAPARKRPGAAAGDAVRELAGRKVPMKFVPRRYRTESGLEVWVGRSDAANDYLTVRLARGKDLFFHLDGAPGSHVILRTEGRSDPPPEAVLDACELAVHYSKQKKASRADVHVVPIRNVRKPKGAKPGLVMVHGGRSIHLRREPKRLQRILAAKIEE